MSKKPVTIVVISAISGVLYFFYLYGISTLGNKKDLNISNKEVDNYFVSSNEPLLASDNDQETIIGGTRKHKKRKRRSKKYFKK
jgi:hypothetical protein